MAFQVDYLSSSYWFYRTQGGLRCAEKNQTECFFQ